MEEMTVEARRTIEKLDAVVKKLSSPANRIGTFLVGQSSDTALIVVGGNRDVTPIALTVQRLIYAYTQRQAETVSDFPLIFSAATLMSIPTILVYLVLQRYFVQGLVGVGIKG